MNKYILFLLAMSPVSVLAENSFEGPYAGIHLGYVEGHDKGKEVFQNGTPNGYTQKTSPDGVLYGLFAGYNKVLENNLLLGLEGEYENRNADDKTFQKQDGVTDPASLAKTSLKNEASIRARLGYIFNDNRTLAYVTGGYAAAEIKRKFSNADTITYPVGSESHTKWQDGWTAGLGLEHLLGNNLSARAEYRYADYGKETVSVAQLYNGNKQHQKYDEEHSVRLGLIYHF